ncbi:MAG: type II toxin-antitoxin system RelE/ParE family toxin [Candidatus Marinimicrobia bacterium]|nr:type II toxin-antitoxin system RelE/ParE family toxin [Candidatus Neomarinimicrobiota bacterium]
MNYKLKFMPNALKDFQKLDGTIKNEFKKILQKRLKNPIVEKHRLHGDYKGHFKIKLRANAYRLIYRVLDKELFIVVVEVGRRDKI